MMMDCFWCCYKYCWIGYVANDIRPFYSSDCFAAALGGGNASPGSIRVDTVDGSGAITAVSWLVVVLETIM